jgi:class 3 adenylate cyclase
MDSRIPETDSERRQATVLFADIAGFTAMSERMDPEEVTAVINRCFAMLEDVVRQHGGHVDKYIGDCVMALFGLPKALEHAPRQGVNAAIEMRRRLYAMNDEQHLPVPLAIHIGINSGLVVAGHVGGAVKRDYTVMGDVVNLASRLKDAAPKGSVYVGPETHRYTGDDFEYRQLPALRVKGKEAPVVAYELRSSTTRVHRPSITRGDRTMFSDLVGRSDELRRLREAVAAVTRGHGGIVNLVGEAGMGKSRLLAELLAGEQLDAVTRLEGRALSVGQGLAFHPFVDLLRRWAGIAEDDGEQVAHGKLEAAITQVAPADAAEMLPFVATLMGMRLTGAHAERIAGIEGEAMEKLITKSIRDLLHTLATVRPVVLVLEDLHWADLSSIKLLEFLLRLAVEAPVLFIHGLRPDHPQTSQRVLKVAHERHPRYVHDVELQPLDAAACDVLVNNLLATDDLPYPIRAAIVRKAEGNPFYIEEVIRSLVDQGVIEARHGRFRVIGTLDAVVIPGTVQEVIMARVDRLPDRPRRILQIASVVGRRFPYPVLAEILRDDAQLEWALGHLKRSALLEESRVGDEIEYVFKHALIQETVYGSLLQKIRRQLHVDVARAIETLYASRLPEFYGMLAYHYSRAEDLAKAEEYLFKAGDEAARAAAPSEALNYFREASRVYLMIHGAGGEPAKKALLERNIALALFQTGNLIESSAHFDRALAHLGERVPTSRAEILLRFGIDLAGLLAHLYLPLRVRRPRARRTRSGR